MAQEMSVTFTTLHNNQVYYLQKVFNAIIALKRMGVSPASLVL